MSNPFYLIVPSNTPGFPDNRTNKFKIHLPKKLIFDGSWVVGLTGIIYPNRYIFIWNIYIIHFEVGQPLEQFRNNILLLI